MERREWKRRSGGGGSGEAAGTRVVLKEAAETVAEEMEAVKVAVRVAATAAVKTAEEAMGGVAVVVRAAAGMVARLNKEHPNGRDPAPCAHGHRPHAQPFGNI